MVSQRKAIPARSWDPVDEDDFADTESVNELSIKLALLIAQYGNEHPSLWY